jgi:hypothetical protein
MPRFRAKPTQLMKAHGARRDHGEHADRGAGGPTGHDQHEAHCRQLPKSLAACGGRQSVPEQSIKVRIVLNRPLLEPRPSQSAGASSSWTPFADTRSAVERSSSPRDATGSYPDLAGAHPPAPEADGR